MHAYTCTYKTFNECMYEPASHVVNHYKVGKGM